MKTQTTEDLVSKYVDFGDEEELDYVTTGELLVLDETSSFVEDNFFLLNTKTNVFEIFNILRGFLDENGLLDSILLLRLIDGRKLPFEQTLLDIPYIHSGYLEERERLRKQTNDR